MEVEVGLRVVRGADWEWGDQDGGEGHVGTVVEMEGERGGDKEGQRVVVHWDCGERSSYRCGLEGKYDLRVLDSAPTGIMHNGVICDSCGREDLLSGMRWECTRCCDYDLCSICYMVGRHNLEHEFFRYHKERIMRHYIPARAGARRIRAKGIFPKAKVVRGIDWEYGNEDGGDGNLGTVVILKNWKPGSYRSAVDVMWTTESEASSKTMTCRLGHEGKVDLKYTTPSSAGFYYPDHLPLLGAPYQPPGPTEYGYGDYVKVELDKWLQHNLEEGNMQANLERLLPVLGKTGTIQSISDTKIASVKFCGDKKITVPTDALEKVDIPIFLPKQAVRIIDDLAEVMKLQKDHGGWIDEMSNTIGRVGVVVGQQFSGDVVISVDGKPYAFNPQCLILAPEESVTLDLKSVDFKRVDEQLQAEMQSLFEKDDPLALLRAATLGDETITREFLNKFRNEINRRFQDDLTVLHHAAIAGQVSIIKILLEFGADKDVVDNNGATPLHYCILKYEIEAAKLLLEAGANPNLKDKLGRTPLILAALKGKTNIIELLVKYPSVDLNVQDEDGDTALHCAVSSNWHWSVHLLLAAGAKHEIMNSKGYLPLHVASGLGFTGGVEEILKYFPLHINHKGAEECTPLHLATLNGHSDIVGYLIMKKCEIEAKSLKGYTALHCSIVSGALKITEKLVKHGADVNARDNDGDTPMHLLSMADKDLKPVTADMPELMKVKSLLKESGHETVTTRTVLACYLVQKGANIFMENNKGEIALNRLPVEEVGLVATFCEKLKVNR